MSWSIDAEISKTDGLQAKKFKIYFAIIFPGEFLEGVGNQGVGGHGFNKGEFFLIPIYRGTGGKNKPFDTIISASLKQVHGAVDVDVVGFNGIVDGKLQSW